MAAENNKEQNYPNLDEFEKLSIEEKLSIFNSFPIPVQKLLVGASVFVIPGREEWAQETSELSDEEFVEAKKILSKTEFLITSDLEITKGLVEKKLLIAKPMRNFINIDLLKIWQEQEKRNKNS